MKLLPKDFSAKIIFIKLKVGIGSKFAIKSLKSFGRGAQKVYIAAKDLSNFITINKVSPNMIVLIFDCRMSEPSLNQDDRSNLGKSLRDVSSLKTRQGTNERKIVTNQREDSNWFHLTLVSVLTGMWSQDVSTKADSPELSFKAILIIATNTIAPKVGSCLQQRLNINNAIQTFGEVFCSDPVGSWQMVMVPGGAVMISAMLLHIGEVSIVINTKAYLCLKSSNNLITIQIFGEDFCSDPVGSRQMVMVLGGTVTTLSAILQNFGVVYCSIFVGHDPFIRTLPFIARNVQVVSAIALEVFTEDKMDAPHVRNDINVAKKLHHRVVKEQEVKCIKFYSIQLSPK